jgi:hypothetical protein
MSTITYASVATVLWNLQKKSIDDAGGWDAYVGIMRMVSAERKAMCRRHKKSRPRWTSLGESTATGSTAAAIGVGAGIGVTAGLGWSAWKEGLRNVRWASGLGPGLIGAMFAPGLYAGGTTYDIRAITDPTSCDYSTGDPAQAAACATVASMGQLAGLTAIKKVGRRAVRAASSMFESSSTVPAVKEALTDITADVAEKTGEEIAVHTAEQCTVRAVEEVVTEEVGAVMGVLAAAAGPVGILIDAAILVMEIGFFMVDSQDLHGWGNTWFDEAANNAAIATRSKVDAQMKQAACKAFDQWLDTHAHQIKTSNISKETIACLRCKFTKFPHVVRPMTTFYKNDPIVRNKLAQYALDYLHFTATPPSQQSIQGTPILPPSMNPKTGEPDKQKWYPRTHNSENIEIDFSRHKPIPGIGKKIRMGAYHRWFLRNVSLYVWGRNRRVGSWMGDHPYLATGLLLFPLLVVLILYTAIKYTTATALT